VSASTWRWISTTTARWRSASRRLLRVSRPAPFARQADVALGVRQADVGALQRVLRLRHVDLRDRAAFEGALVTLQVAHRGLARDLRFVQRLARVGARELRVERGAAGFGFEAGERGFFLRELAAQFRGCRSRRGPGPSSPQSPATDLERDRAAGDRVQAPGCWRR
jgi:hypothetical protein